MNKSRWGEIEKRFSKARKSYRHYAVVQDKAAQLLVEKFAHLIKSHESVLDIGAGVGLLTEKLLPFTEKLYACDLSKEALKENPLKEKKKFTCNMERLPLKNRSVDWLVSNFALHWSNWKKTLREIDRVSRRGYFFSVPVKGSIKGLNFPFPEAEEILEIVKPNSWFIKEIEIPFRGREFLLFFKRTGTGFNPNKRISAFEILKKPSLVGNYSFYVLFLLKVWD
ncbi:MAG: methyltransferase domain-containing protein [Aquificae bacterium]|nr:methyltransferase domain-containing protein [Aquificota bacterium]